MNIYNNYYVYGHYQNDKLVYIGKGLDSRAWSNKRTNKIHKEWVDKQIVNNNWGNCVKLLHVNLSSKEARKKEIDLILKENPIWNSEGKDFVCEHCNYIAKSAAGRASHIRNNHK